MRILVGILFTIISFFSFSQGETDQQLAQHYYSNGDFEKAVMYYVKIYDNDPSKFNFNRYYECLIQTGNKKEAEKVLKKQSNNNRFDIEYKILLGQFYEENNAVDKAQKIYDELISELVPDPTSIINLFNAFKTKGRNELALATIEKGRKLLKNN